MILGFPRGPLRDPTITTKCVLKVLWGRGYFVWMMKERGLVKDSLSLREVCRIILSTCLEAFPLVVFL